MLRMVALFLSLSLSAQAHARIPRCGDLLAESPNTNESHEEFLRVHHLQDGRWIYEVLVHEIYHSEARKTHRMYRQVREGLPSDLITEIRKKYPGLTPAENADRVAAAFRERARDRAWHRRQVMPLVRWVNRKYELRRAWSAKTRAKFRRVAKLYLDDSVYSWTTEGPEDLISGVMRVIQVPYGRRNGVKVAEGWPMRSLYGVEEGYRIVNLEDSRWEPDLEFDETYDSHDGDPEVGEVEEGALPLPPDRVPEAAAFDIDYLDEGVPTFEDPQLRVGLHNEIGTFGIDETKPYAQRLQIACELWLQLMKLTFNHTDDRFSFYGQTFHAYADPLSLKLYVPLGMTPLERYQRGTDLVDIVEGVPPTIPLEGTEWLPLIFHPYEMWALNIKGSLGGTPHARVFDFSRRRREVNQHQLFTDAEAKEALPVLVEHFLSSDLHTSMTAIDAIGLYFSSGDAHRSVLEDPLSDRIQRRYAVRALREIDENALVFEELLPKMMASPDPEVRMHLPGPMLHISDSDLKQGLTRTTLFRKVIAPLCLDEDISVRLHAIHQLRNFLLYRPLKEQLTPGLSPPAAHKLLLDSGLSETQIETIVESLLRIFRSETVTTSKGVTYWTPVNRALEYWVYVTLHVPERSPEVMFALLCLFSEAEGDSRPVLNFETSLPIGSDQGVLP